MGSGSSGFYCPICGSELVTVKYVGDERDKLALMERADFCCFLGCIREDLHDKVVDGVNYRGEVFIRPMFHAHGLVRKDKKGL